jgi:tol-pal system protein YbgF
MEMEMEIKRYKLSIVSLCLITCASVLLTSSIAISSKERKIALVIGNGAYKSSPLLNPVNDANDMANVLKKIGFSVRLKVNANQRSMEKAIRSFGKDLRSGGVGLFYFAGHGIQVYGRNYIIPIGANIQSEADVKYESVDAERVLSQMYEAENGLNIIILDACRDNPYARSFRSSEKGLAKMDAPTGSILAYATAPGSVAADGTGRNGLYTSKLLKYMMEPNLPIERVFKRVRIDVVKASGNRQTPWESSSLMGDFYFNTKRGIAVVQPPVNTDLDAKQKRIETELNKQLEKESLKYTSISPKASRPEVIELNALNYAKRAFDKDDFDTARKGFQKLLKEFPKSEYADDAQFGIGESYFREKWYEKAILEYQKVIENYPKGNMVAASRLKQGISFLRLKDKSNANLIFKEIIEKHPESDAAKIAKRILNKNSR